MRVFIKEDRNLIKFLRQDALLQCKTIIKGVLSWALVSFISGLNAVSAGCSQY